MSKLVEELRLFANDDAGAMIIGPHHARELLAHIERLESLVLCLLQNDPDDIVADGGITVLDVWRKDAEKVVSILESTTTQTKTKPDSNLLGGAG